jgi:hypothetical protein
MKWALLALGVLLVVLLLRSTEHFKDPEYTNGTRPCFCPTNDQSLPSAAQPCDPSCAAWDSKIEALAPIGANNSDYVTVLQAFYDQVYVPTPSRPTEAQVNTFLASPAGTVAGVDNAAVKRIMMNAFHIQGSLTAAQSEEASQNFKPVDADLAPEMGRDEVRTRKEDQYVAANPKPSTRLSEGDYAPVTQSKPLNPGQWEDGSTMWKGPRPASVCPCAENIM